MATHSIVLAWRIPGTAEHGGLLSIGSHRVGHDGSDLAAAAAIWFYSNKATQEDFHQQNTDWNSSCAVYLLNTIFSLHW